MQVTSADMQMAPLTKLEQEGKLEKVFGDLGPRTLEWYKLGLSRCSCVARIETKTGRGMGTGFIVDGGEVHRSFRDSFLVLTNAHVISSDPDIEPTLRPDKARGSFECWLDGCQSYDVCACCLELPAG
jgi:S1-C subfamily serine protease